MYINQNKITPQRPTQHQQQFGLSQDYMDDDQIDKQLPTNLALSEVETEQKHKEQAHHKQDTNQGTSIQNPQEP